MFSLCLILMIGIYLHMCTLLYKSNQVLNILTPKHLKLFFFLLLFYFKLSTFWSLLLQSHIYRFLCSFDTLIHPLYCFLKWIHNISRIKSKFLCITLPSEIWSLPIFTALSPVFHIIPYSTHSKLCTDVPSFIARCFT